MLIRNERENIRKWSNIKCEAGAHKEGEKKCEEFYCPLVFKRYCSHKLSGIAQGFQQFFI
jgi:hypothetical protein